MKKSGYLSIDIIRKYVQMYKQDALRERNSPPCLVLGSWNLAKRETFQQLQPQCYQLFFVQCLSCTDKFREICSFDTPLCC